MRCKADRGNIEYHRAARLIPEHRVSALGCRVTFLAVHKRSVTLSDDHRRSFPPSLNAVRSEFQILCDAHGGPVPLIAAADPNGLQNALEHACSEFFFAKSWDAYRDWEPDKVIAMQHWPWVAFAASQYRFEREQKGQYSDEPTPTEIRNLVRSIAKGALTLGQNLVRLKDLSSRLGDMEAPDRRAHLAWLHEFIAQNILGIRRDIDDSPEAMAASHFAVLDLYRRLICIEVAAGEADKRIMPELLRRPRMQGDRGLTRLVFRAKLIWKSLTGRTASVNKVTRAGSADNRPDFTIFVSNIAKLACNHEPTLDEIETAFRTPNSAKRKLQ